MNDDEVTVPFGSAVYPLEVACGTYVYVQHPPDHTLRLDSPTWATSSTSEHLAILVPETETANTFVLAVDSGGPTVPVRVNTKKEPTKPDPTRPVGFGV